MTAGRSATSSVRRTARLHAPAGRRGLRWLARAGLIARGAVYGVVGILALKLALGLGGETASQQGALERIAHEPFGQGLLVALAIGLAGYAVWRLVSAVAGSGSTEDGAMERVGAAASGLAYAALCATAIKILFGASASGGASSPKKATAGVLGWTGGPELVGIAGVILLGAALYQGYKGVARKFLDECRCTEMSAAVRRGFTALGVFGHLARMLVFGLIGYGLIKAAIAYNPRDAIGLDGALQKLSHSSDGPVLLGIVAGGFVSFGLYSIVEARYRKV